MDQVTIEMRVLQKGLAKAIRFVAQGGCVLVRSAGKVVAKISGVPEELPQRASIQRKLRALAAQGKLRLGKPGKIKPFTPLEIDGLTERVLKDRR